MAKNNTLNTTELMTGKDGKLFVEAGDVQVFLAEINTYSVNMNVVTTERQPVGSILVHRIPTGVTSVSYTHLSAGRWRSILCARSRVSHQMPWKS